MWAIIFQRGLQKNITSMNPVVRSVQIFRKLHGLGYQQLSYIMAQGGTFRLKMPGLLALSESVEVNGIRKAYFWKGFERLLQGSRVRQLAEIIIP
jgi:hypothetical protein